VPEVTQAAAVPLTIDLRENLLGGLDFAALFGALPTAYLVMTPDLVIVEANAAYLGLVGRTRRELVGRPVFDAFPPGPESLDADGRNQVGLSFERVRDTGVREQMPLVNWDVVDLVTGVLQQRYWSLASAAVRDEEGRTALVVQSVEDVTRYVVQRRERAEQPPGEEVWVSPLEVIDASLFSRGQELRAALEAEARATRRLTGLAEAALRLTGAETIDDLNAVVAAAMLAALGVDNTAIGVLQPDGSTRLSVLDPLGSVPRHSFHDLPPDSAVPAAWVARYGRPLLLPDCAAGTAWSPAMAGLYERTGRHAWAIVPLQVGDRQLGSLSAGWVQEGGFGVEDVTMLTVFAAQTAQALDRMQVRDVERDAAAQSRELSEALQLSLLTDPPELERLSVAVRYLPASTGAQVGGDWYDAFSSAAGVTTLVIGDVTGHDVKAAAAMGQIRNVLRGVAQVVDGSPAAVMSALDRTLATLHVDTLATAVVGHVRQDDGQVAAGTGTFAWSNAGHLPPLLIEADGTVSLLSFDADLLLGLEPEAPRTSHRIALTRNATVILYTDGLVERRGESLDVGLDRLRKASVGLSGMRVPELCDELLQRLGGHRDDDVALLALRLRSKVDGPAG
jgi:serine phosphatase RsbU (regulator of sigma subunit)